MVKVLPVTFRNHQGELLRGFVHVPAGYDSSRGVAVVFLHGFPGSMFGTAKRVLTPLAKKGFLCLRFEFSGTNTSEGKFEEKLMSKEVKEVGRAIDFLQNEYGFQKLVLMGHSTGAIDAGLYAPTDKRINGLVLSGCVSDLLHAVHYDFSDVEVRQFWERGWIRYSRRGHWADGKKLRKAFYDEFFTLDLPNALKKFRKPVLIVHGEKDEGVPVFNACEVFRMMRGRKKLMIVREADHSYSKRTYAGEVVSAVLKFIGSL